MVVNLLLDNSNVCNNVFAVKSRLEILLSVRTNVFKLIFSERSIAVNSFPVILRLVILLKSSIPVTSVIPLVPIVNILVFSIFFVGTCPSLSISS